MFSARQEGQIMALRLSLDLPDVALAEEGIDGAFALGGNGLGDLLLQEVVISGALDGAEDADGHGELRVVHAAEEEGDGGVVQRLVVDEEVLLADGVLAQLDDLGLEAVETDAFVLVLAEDHGLALLEVEHAVGADLFGGEVLEGAVVVDVAVLVDLGEGGALGPGGGT